MDFFTGLLVFYTAGALLGGFLIASATGRLARAIFLPPALLGLALPVWWVFKDSTDWVRWFGLLLNIFMLAFVLTLPLSAAGAGVAMWLRRKREPRPPAENEGS